MFLILNDVHIGVQRKGGTTPKSQESLRDYLFSSLVSTLSETAADWLVINGDLFDTFEVSARDWLQTFTLMQAWLQRGRKLTLVAGNHDHSPKALRVSSFEMLCDVLQANHPSLVQVVGIDRAAEIGSPRLMALAHCSNQDIFDEALKEVFFKLSEVEEDGTILLLHTNYDNKFAAASDHSLNVDADTARRFKQIGVTLVFAHEHQARTAFGGSVVVLGNQWPTSIADCLGNDNKFAHLIDDNNKITKVETWSRDAELYGYKEIDWRELNESNADFIRVVGEATSGEASAVINAISKFRQRSEAMVVSNAVKIDGVAEVSELPTSFEAARAFDVMEFMSQYMSAEEMVVVRSLAS